MSRARMQLSLASVSPPASPAAARRQIPWIAAVLVGGFLIPFILADQLSPPKDLSYGIHGVAVITFLSAWVRATAQPWREMVARRWKLAIVLGLAFGALLAFIVLMGPPGLEPGTKGL